MGDGLLAADQATRIDFKNYVYRKCASAAGHLVLFRLLIETMASPYDL
jgi:hypothetical protein